jgi:hypothetical protein
MIKYSSDEFVSSVIAPWRRRLVDCFSPLRLKFDPLLLRVRFVVDRMALDRFFFEYFGFSLLISFHQCYRIIFLCMFLLPEGQTREA